MALSTKYFDQAGWLLEDPSLIEKVTIVSTAVDAGNTNERTSILRSGLVLGKITASGKYVQYDDDGTDDGRRVAAGILLQDCDMKDGDPEADAADQTAYILKIGRVDQSRLIGCDANGATDMGKGGTGGCHIIFE